jgi:1-aminocyclopropane-1-carboxylate deaminase
MQLQNSPIQSVTFKDQTFLLKRDDLLESDFSGNKARKLLYFLHNDFPNIDTIISYGSNQSNAMYSLSVLAKLKNWNFIYYCDHIPSFLQQTPSGNFKHALENKMEIKLLSQDQTIKDISFDPQTTLFIKEGGAIKEAEYGIKTLADEIKEYKKNNNIQILKIFLPSGTGTTALFLQKHLKDEVLTCPCVGDSEYLKKQFLELEEDKTLHPTILDTDKKYHFGKLYKENYLLWEEIKNSINIEFDLLYDPIGLRTFFALDKNQNTTYLYIHQGGIKGNETMIQRYWHKFMSIEK